MVPLATGVDHGHDDARGVRLEVPRFRSVDVGVVPLIESPLRWIARVVRISDGVDDHVRGRVPDAGDRTEPLAGGADVGARLEIEPPEIVSEETAVTRGPDRSLRSEERRVGKECRL